MGMTRGRASNVALAVCDDTDVEHRPAGPNRSETEVVLAAMGRSAAEVAALEALREAFARSESLATLAPRLANLNAELARETPPDRSKELQWATEALEQLLELPLGAKVLVRGGGGSGIRTRGAHAQRFSRPPHSAALPSLQR